MTSMVASMRRPRRRILMWAVEPTCSGVSEGTTSSTMLFHSGILATSLRYANTSSTGRSMLTGISTLTISFSPPVTCRMNCRQWCHRAELGAWAKLPNCALVSVPHRVGGGLGAALQVELGEDAAHVMLGGSPADEKPRRELVVRETEAEQLEDLVFTPAQGSPTLWTGAS